MPGELLALASVPVIEIDKEILHENGKTIKITKATIVSIGLLAHKKGDMVKSMAEQISGL